MVTNDRTPSPRFHSLRLPEFGEESHSLTTVDTPASTTVELGHEADTSASLAATHLLITTNMTDPASEEPRWEFTFIDSDIPDDSPPA